MGITHTPGPWYILTGLVDHEQDRAMNVIQTAEGEIVAELLTPLLADGYLLAAAPTMREALQEISNWLVCAAIATPEDMAQNFGYMQQLAESAIERARGDS